MGIQLGSTSLNTPHTRPETSRPETSRPETSRPDTPAVAANPAIAAWNGTSTFQRSSASAPFTGSGATGARAGGELPLLDQIGMSIQKWAPAGVVSALPDVAAKYDNPLTDGDAYLAALGPLTRTRQATQLLDHTIDTIDPARYGDNTLPTRRQVIAEAAEKYRLDPAHVASIILAEQRDQSAAEDQKDIAGAISWFRANTSIGLGQITVGTAKKDGAALLSDLLSPEQRAKLSHAGVARHLQSDDHNIYATARYLRETADAGATKTIADLPNTARAYPGLDFAIFREHSSAWTRQHFELLASEYTSKPWDDRLSPTWAKFAGDALDDVRAEADQSQMRPR